MTVNDTRNVIALGLMSTILVVLATNRTPLQWASSGATFIKEKWRDRKSVQVPEFIPKGFARGWALNSERAAEED